MRNSVELDNLLENAVATALCIDKPHQEMKFRPRMSRRKITRRAHRSTSTPHRERARVAA